MSLTRIASAFYTEPWLIREDIHRDLGSLLQAAIAEGSAREQLVAMRQQQQPDPPGMLVEDGIALTTLRGVVGKHLGLMETLCAGGYDLALYERQMLEVQRRDDIHTVAIIFDTPGGRAVGTPEAAALTAQVAETKRVVAYLDQEACSAGYYIAAPCDTIAAGPSAIVGSIGAYSAFLDRTRQLEMDGLKLQVFSDGKYKGMGMAGTELTKEQEAFFKDRTAKIGGEFKRFVSSHRPQVSAATMQGQFMSAEEGVDAGLVDEIHLTFDHFLATLL